MDRICVYCGASPGTDPAYRAAAEGVAEALAAHDLDLVFGGGRVGLMGSVADSALEAGCEVYGVIPESLVDREIAHEGVTHLEIVGSMHDRKERMVELADGFVGLPGGYGTLEELIEVLTWGQLGLHPYPCGFYDVDGFYSDLLAFFDHATSEGFISESHRGMLVVTDDIEALLERFARYSPPDVKGYDLDRT